MKENTDYTVMSSTFLGVDTHNDKIISYKYEIAFNKSLEHTGRFKGIEDGLNKYVKNEKRQNFYKSIFNVWRSFVYLIKN